MDGFINLKKFNCCGNKITSLDLSGSPKLEDLQCHNNNLDDLQFLNYLDPKNLTILKISNNDFPSTDFIRNGKFNRFYGSLKELKNLEELKSLGISSTDVSEEGLELLPNLEKIYCQDYDSNNYPIEHSSQKENNSKLAIYESSVNAQEWLEKNCSKEKREQIIDLLINNKGLEGNLKVENFPMLKVLYSSFNPIKRLSLINLPSLISVKSTSNGPIEEVKVNRCPNIHHFIIKNNLISSFDFNSLNPEKLTELDISNNNFPEQDLSFLALFVNLSELYIGNHNEEKVKNGTYNHFTGSLKPLKDMKKLTYLAIESTDIDRGLEFLSASVKKINCYNRGQKDNAGCLKIKEELEILAPWRQAKTLPQQLETANATINTVRTELRIIVDINADSLRPFRLARDNLPEVQNRLTNIENQIKNILGRNNDNALPENWIEQIPNNRTLLQRMRSPETIIASAITGTFGIIGILITSTLEFHQRLKALASKEKCLMIEILEQAIELYEKDRKERKKKVVGKADLATFLSTTTEKLQINGDVFSYLDTSKCGSFPIRELRFQLDASSKTVDFNLKDFPKLTKLEIFGGRSINSLDLTSNAKLEEIELNGEVARNLDLKIFSHLTNLKKLKLDKYHGVIPKDGIEYLNLDKLKHLYLGLELLPYNERSNSGYTGKSRYSNPAIDPELDKRITEVEKITPGLQYKSKLEILQEFRTQKLKESNIQPKNILKSNSLEVVYHCTALSRWEIFTCLIEKKPHNLTELTSLLNKDYANVWKDVQALQGLEIIKLKKVGKEIRPIALYDRLVFDFPVIPTTLSH
ncbi:1556_t:CDS:2 [Funneliformis geosporum]|uniref:1556_t:CDS:1 n=1 Tax=Funneliformis geosporum TaxID=1117311 RepID=A0A9W4WIS4_9GLOM|nr:1556_t:CDS:2 [Funneliformis geosporum]